MKVLVGVFNKEKVLIGFFEYYLLRHDTFHSSCVVERIECLKSLSLPTIRLGDDH